MFMSEYNHTLDAKGRLIIPLKFREQLGETFMISRGLDHCLFSYPMAEWDAFIQKLLNIPQLSNPNARKLARFFLAGAAQVEVDKQGRILISPVLREFAGLSKDVVLAGVGSRIEVWDKASWQEYNDYEDVEGLAKTLEAFNI